MLVPQASTNEFGNVIWFYNVTYSPVISNWSICISNIPPRIESADEFTWKWLIITFSKLWTFTPDMLYQVSVSLGHTNAFFTYAIAFTINTSTVSYLSFTMCRVSRWWNGTLSHKRFFEHHNLLSFM